MSTYTVNTTIDENDGINIGKISLRDAIAAANANPGADIINFNAGLTGKTILLNKGVLNISSDLTISGLGEDKLTISGNQQSGVFNINDFNGNQQANVFLERLKITGAKSLGTAAVSTTENLTIKNTTISGNTSTDLPEDISGFFGEVYTAAGVASFNGTLTITNSTIANNKAGFGGAGGIFARKKAIISDTTISGNTSEWKGGGIYSKLFDSLTLINSTVSGNSSGSGGGIYSTKTLNLIGSTLTNNSAYDGSGLYNTGRANVGNTIISGNIDSRIQKLGQDVDGYGTIISKGYNLIGADNTSSFNQIGDVTDVLEPGLLPLANNGGATLTHALKSDSLAINAGSNSLIPTGVNFDQRGTGFARILGGFVDIGAYESANFTPKLSINDVSITEGNTGTTTANFTVSLTNASSSTITVKYRTADGTAKLAGGDYDATSGTLTFAPGQTSKNITVAVRGDLLKESNETFYLNLSNSTNSIIDDNKGKGTINNDDTLIGNVRTLTGSTNSDSFVLGNVSKPHYNLIGNLDYALIKRFDPQEDRIQLHGSLNDYKLASTASGVGIYLKTSGAEDLLGIVTNNIPLNLNSDNFLFV